MPSASRAVLIPKVSASRSVARVTVLLKGVRTKKNALKMSASSGKPAGSATPRTPQRSPQRRTALSKRARVRDRWGVRGVADPAGLPLLALILSAFFFVLTPFSNTVTRATEREADTFGINTAREADGMAKVALKLGVYRKLDPGPLEEFIFFDHP